MKSIYSSDRKAPRMKKGQFSKMVVTKDLHKKFIDTYPLHKDVTWREFYESWLDIAESIRHEAINNPLGVKLGFYLGELKLQFLPYKFKANDPATGEKEGIKVDYLNLDTRGKVAKIKWERRAAVKHNKILQFYAFDETRELNRLAFEFLQKNPEKPRIARITTGGVSVWRQKMKNK